MKRWFKPIAFLLFFLAPCPRAWSSDRAGAKGEAEFQLVNGSIVVEAKTDLGTLHLKLDTGSPALVLFPDSVQSGGSTGKLSHLEVAGVDLGTTPFEVIGNVTLARWNAANHESRIDGLLGIAPLRSHAVGLDMVGRRLKMWKRRATNVESRRFLLADMAAKEDDSTIHTSALDVKERVSLDVDLGTVTTSMMLDTGAAVGVAGIRLAPYLPAMIKDLPLPINMMGVDYNARLNAVREINVAGLSVQNWQYVALESSDPLLFNGILGLSAFNGCRLIIDFPGRKLLLVLANRSAERVSQRLRSLGLLTLFSSPDVFGVPVLASPLSKSELPAGALITRINGIRLDELNDSNVRAIKSHPEDSVVLTLGASEPRQSFDASYPIRGNLLTEDKVATFSGPLVHLVPEQSVVLYMPDGGIYVPARHEGVVPLDSAYKIRIPLGANGVVLSGPNVKFEKNRNGAGNGLEGALYRGNGTNIVACPPGSWIEEQLPVEGHSGPTGVVILRPRPK